MYYELEGLGRYYTTYAADFAAKTHAKASGNLVYMNVLTENSTPSSRRIYYLSGRVEVIQ